MRFLLLDEVIELHKRILEQSGGMGGLRDRTVLESAPAQPRMTFGGQDLHPTIVEKGEGRSPRVLSSQ